MKAVKHSYCAVTGTALYYEITGSGTPVVFLHGNPVDNTCWDFQIPEISKHYQIIRYDLRGLGTLVDQSLLLLAIHMQMILSRCLII